MEPAASLDRLARIYLLLGLTQAAHSMEEVGARLYDFFWTVTGILHRHVPFIPQFRMDGDLFAALNIALVAVILAVVPFVRAEQRWARRFAAVVGVIEIINGIDHLSAAIYFRGYVPGALTAPFLLIGGIWLLRELRRSRAVRLRSAAGA